VTDKFLDDNSCVRYVDELYDDGQLAALAR
jgi:hypothetical protein